MHIEIKISGSRLPCSLFMLKHCNLTTQSLTSIVRPTECWIIEVLLYQSALPIFPIHLIMCHFLSIFFRGGSGGGPCPTNDAWSFDSTTGRWTQIPSCPTPRVWSAMAPLTNRPGMAVLYGGSEKFSPQLISVSYTIRVL